MRSVAKDFHVPERTIRNVVQEDVIYMTYVMRKSQFMSEGGIEIKNEKHLVSGGKEPSKVACRETDAHPTKSTDSDLSICTDIEYK